MTENLFQLRAATLAVGISAALVLTGSGTVRAQPEQAAAAQDVEGRTYDLEAVTPYEFDGDVRDLPKRAFVTPKPYVRRELEVPPSTMKASPAELAAQEINIALGPMPGPIRNFAGLSHSDSCDGGQCGSGWPPDTNGDVGLNHYIQAVNTAFAIYAKTGGLLRSFTEDQLWSGTGSNPCNGDSQGDPIVVYDPLGDRWILTNFAYTRASDGTDGPPFYECIAVSKTSDPVAGGWYLWPVRMDTGGTGQPPVGTLADYPKFGIWPDCLYMAANEFAEPIGTFIGTSFASISRTDLESGHYTGARGFINNASGPSSMVPSNLSGALPPPGTPNYYVSVSHSQYAFEVRKFTAGPNCGAGGTLGAPTNVSQTPYTIPNGAVVPQPGTTTDLDTLKDRLMQKVQYRNIDGTESLWVTHTFQSSSSGPTGAQWAQIDVTGGTIATKPVQQQKYDPGDGIYRWMGSIAVDGAGNVALGYSTSNGAAPNYPSIAYAGRLATDPLNQLPRNEVQLIGGAGSQTICGGEPCDRWGDYSAMSVDPSDDCTFWYTSEYYSSQANATVGNWQTRIGSFKFPSCGASLPTVTPTPRTSPTITCGQSVDGSLDPTDPKLSDGTWIDTYSFTLTTATTVTFAMTAADFDPYLFVLDVALNKLAHGRPPLAVTLPAGDYVVWANNFAQLPDGSYPYELRLTCTSAGVTPSATPTLPRTMTPSRTPDATPTLPRTATLTPPTPPSRTATPTLTPTKTPTRTATRLVTATTNPTNTPNGTPSSGARVRIGSGATAPGGNISVPLEALGVVNLGAATIEVRYDPTVIHATACQFDPNHVFSASVCNTAFAPDAVRFTAASATGVSGDALLANITFQGVGTAGTASVLDVVIVAFADAGGAALPAADQDGQITVGLNGDVNCDGVLSSIDALFVLQYDAGLRGGGTQCPQQSNTLFMSPCDVNGDGACNSIDALFILQCEVGIPNVLCPHPAAARVTTSMLHQRSAQRGSATLRVGSGTASPGRSISVPVEVLGVANLGAATIEVHYDPTVVHASACQFDPNHTFSASVCNSAYAPDVVRFTAASIVGVSGDALLANITFEAVGAPGAASGLNVVIVTFADVGGVALAETGQDGQITIAGAIPSCVGDCDGGGMVTVDEVLMMVNVALGSADVSICRPGDANTDDQITVDEILSAVNNALNGCPGTG